MLELILAALIIITPVGPPVFCGLGQYAVFYALGVPFDNYIAAEHWLQMEYGIINPEAFIDCGCL